MSIDIGCRKITKLQRGKNDEHVNFFNLAFFLLQKKLAKIVKFLLIKKRLRSAIEVDFLNKMQFTPDQQIE